MQINIPLLCERNGAIVKSRGTRDPIGTRVSMASQGAWSVVLTSQIGHRSHRAMQINDLLGFGFAALAMEESSLKK
jgi:hypothetical protein